MSIIYIIFVLDPCLTLDGCPISSRNFDVEKLTILVLFLIHKLQVSNNKNMIRFKRHTKFIFFILQILYRIYYIFNVFSKCPCPTFLAFSMSVCPCIVVSNLVLHPCLFVSCNFSLRLQTLDWLVAFD